MELDSKEPADVKPRMTSSPAKLTPSKDRQGSINRAIKSSINLKLFQGPPSEYEEPLFVNEPLKRKRNPDQEEMELSSASEETKSNNSEVSIPGQDNVKEKKYFYCQAPGCVEAFRNNKDYELHYNEKHKYTCSQCKKILSSAHILDLHLLELHDSFFALMAEKKPSYSCLESNCPEKFIDADDRFEHCINLHKYPIESKHKYSVGKVTGKYRKPPKKKNPNKNKEEFDQTKEESSNLEEMETNQEVKKPINPPPPPLPPGETVKGKQHYSFGHSAGKSKTFAIKKNTKEVKGLGGGNQAKVKEIQMAELACALAETESNAPENEMSLN